MSLRLSRKQPGQESEEGQRQLGHAPTQSRGGGSWLGSKPRAPLGRPAGPKSGDAQQPNETAAGGGSSGHHAQAEPGFYTPKGKGGKGKGRGSANFVARFVEQESASSLADATPSEPASSSSAQVQNSGAAIASIPEQDLGCAEGVEGLAQVLQVAQLQRCSEGSEAAEAWCDEQGAANHSELLEELIRAGDQGDEQKLITCIAKAEEAGVDANALERARASLDALQELARRRTAAEHAVSGELDKGDLEAIIRAVKDAEDLGVSERALKKARAKVKALQDAAEKHQKEKEAARQREAAAEEALLELRTAVEGGDAAAIGAAITKAEKSGSKSEEVAAAKRMLFQLQKEKRDQAKRDKDRKEALEKVQAAVAGESADDLQEAISLAEKAGSTSTELQDAHARLEVLQELQKQKAIQDALDDLQYFIDQGDVEAATLTLEDAAKVGASPEELARSEKNLADLRERLDPEAEARRRRLEARKAKDGTRKWNFAGKSDNRIINDRFREHEAELERRRMLAFRARGRFKGDAEDEGEEGQEKNIRKQRTEVSKEKGYVPPPPKNEPVKGFTFARSPKEETEAPRRLTLRAHLEMGLGIDLHASWWGMIVDSIDEQPGQPGLRLRDTLVEVNGLSLRELEDEDCEQRFADSFGDGCVVVVEPHVQLPCVLTNGDGFNRESLQDDLRRFADDWGLQIEIQDTAGSVSSVRILMEGPQSAIKASRPELENVMKFYTES